MFLIMGLNVCTMKSTVDEYLLSAGNNMNRRELRNCLKDTKALHDEFYDIPLNLPDKPHVTASGLRNRYRTIIPNEHSRVKLVEKPGDPLSAYINANYLKGYDGEDKAYIATQGPLPHTVNDFWEMVFQKHSPVIVMITNTSENGMSKCEHYLPKGSEETFGDITVYVGKVELKEGYTVREITLKCGDLTHNAVHYWYTGWPDHKTPTTALPLITMATEIESLRIAPNTNKVIGPVVVHCSAGIGRTGCFIAVSIGMKQLLGENNLDVLGIVCAMRYDRGGMVQTGEQYEFIHRALLMYERMLPDHSGD